MDVPACPKELKDDPIISELARTPPALRARHAMKLLRDQRDCAQTPLAVDRWGDLQPPRRQYNDQVIHRRMFFTYIRSLALAPDDAAWFEEQVVIPYGKHHGIADKTFAVRERIRRNNKSLRCLPHHCVPPYCFDWKAAIVGGEGDTVVDGVRLTDMTFTTRLLGSGGFGRVYVAHAKGRQYALKIMHPWWTDTASDDPLLDVNNAIAKNVGERMPSLERIGGFARIVATCGETRGTHEGSPWYMSDIIPGHNCEHVLFEGTRQGDMGRRCARSYAAMMRALHKEDLLFVDNKWSNMMVAGDDVTFIDPDFIVPDDGSLVSMVNTRNYYCREWLHEDMPTKQGDLESFALMLDHVFSGTTWMDTRDGMAYKGNNRPPYSAERVAMMPYPLREIIPELVNRPRNDAITIDDVCAAIDRI